MHLSKGGTMVLRRRSPHSVMPLFCKYPDKGGAHCETDAEEDVRNEVSERHKRDPRRHSRVRTRQQEEIHRRPERNTHDDAGEQRRDRRGLSRHEHREENSDHNRKRKLNEYANQHRCWSRDQRFDSVHERTERLERHGRTRIGSARINHHASDHQDAAEYSRGDPGGYFRARWSTICRFVRSHFCRICLCCHWIDWPGQTLGLLLLHQNLC